MAVGSPRQNSTGGAGGCLMTCHTVSADGSTLVSGGGVYAGSYNLKTDMPMHSLGGTWDVRSPNTGGTVVTALIPLPRMLVVDPT